MKSHWSLRYVLGFVISVSKVALVATTSSQLFSLQEADTCDAFEEIKNEIKSISNHIALAHSQNENRSELLKLYNERGLRYFCVGLLENSFNDFNYVLNAIESRQEIESPLLALALWGRMLCHAYQNHEEEAFRDLNLFQFYFLSEIPPCTEPKTISEKAASLKANSKQHGFEFPDAALISKNLLLFRQIYNENPSDNIYMQPIAEFANPNEKISIQDCKDRVRCTADIMRLLAGKIPSAALVAAVNVAIARLEEFAIGCCYRNHWTECMSPIIDAYNYMRKCMDKGASIAPHIICPGK